jgi:hypothetical protein
MLQQLLVSMGGNLTQRRVSLWETRDFTATAEDVEHGCVEGVVYTLWVAQKEGKTQTGNPVKQGDWFIVKKA